MKNNDTILTSNIKIFSILLSALFLILVFLNLINPVPPPLSIDYEGLELLPAIEIDEAERERLESMRRHYIRNRKMYEYFKENPLPEAPDRDDIDIPEDLLM